MSDQDLNPPGAEKIALAYPESADSFFVEEIALYPASGEGEHLYLEIEKRDIDTAEVVARIAAGAGISPKLIGWAGRKDKHATARQRISLPRAAGEAALPRLGDANYRVLSARPHTNKLRLGHLLGNRFRLLLCGEANAGCLAANAEMLLKRGLPNYFGHQRFGRDGGNARRGLDLLRRGRKIRDRRDRFAVSAWQSLVFNRVLSARKGSYDQLLDGDLAWIHAKGAVFGVEDPQRESERALAFEVSPTGPMPGGKMTRPQRAAAEIEERIIEQAGWLDSFSRLLRGGRRPLRVPLENWQLEETDEGAQLAFSLPSGSYASRVLAELGVYPK